ncbi:MAG: DUF3795 domain-containing protein [Candidatus Abyssobacteria bacterium SURF_5]|uniref:DUF3795 domain-containing protein n=1 Tax=Abyssobacteria bacterium (strain SURF_5) TaxID=2093360 RepID=A0A3A4NWE7_ABYX5|nr:MAG: DUF3795 domain-containing protein [Candidatus Abyssubacteria bacterium SURF_5]
MAVNPDLLAPCGLYCGVCGVYIAHRDDNDKFKERLATVYGVTPAEVRCKGCLSNDPFGYCRMCPIKNCSTKKGYQGCHQCSDFPCELIENFPLPVGKRVINRAIPQWREMGTEKWVAAEEARYVCPHCGASLFRGAKRCRECKEAVDMD